MGRHLKDSLAYMLVFCPGFLAACTGARMTGNNPTTLVAHMLNSSEHHPTIFATNTGNQPAIAAMFANITNPSQLAQSYDSVCDAFGTTVGIHAALGTSALVEMNFRRGNLCTTVVASAGADVTPNPLGFPVVLQGTINDLVVTGVFVSGKRFRCLDTTNTGSVSDNTFVRAYYDLTHDSVVVGNGTTALPVTCSITIPAGDDVQSIKVQWIKS